MYCPECSGEYREGFTHCADCDVDLVETLPASRGVAPVVDLITVLETSDPAEIAFVESLLRGAGIRFAKAGDHLQNLFGLGTLGFNAVACPMMIQVAAEDAEAATQLLEDSMGEELEDPDFAAEPE
ncbi:MAG TPA: DUF2007 domain-containing protein [Thermoanaerobaculia bacterium]|jgi:hypothetical protein